MNLKLFVDIYNRKLVKSVTSDFPVSLPTIFREDWIDLEVTLLEPTGTITSPVSVVDVAALSIKVAIGNPQLKTIAPHPAPAYAHAHEIHFIGPSGVGSTDWPTGFSFLPSSRANPATRPTPATARGPRTGGRKGHRQAGHRVGELHHSHP